MYGFSAKGAVLSLAWGSAPGSRKRKTASAESAIHPGAFSVGGDAPGWHETAPLALNRYSVKTLAYSSNADVVSSDIFVRFCLTFLSDKVHSRHIRKEGGDFLMHNIPLSPKARFGLGCLIVGLVLLLPAHPVLSQG